MRVLILNTSEKTGGAAVAANRLMDALNNNGVKAKMLVRDKETDHISVVGLSNPLIQQWRFLWERLVIFFHLHLLRTGSPCGGSQYTRSIFGRNLSGM